MRHPHALGRHVLIVPGSAKHMPFRTSSPCHTSTRKVNSFASSRLELMAEPDGLKGDITNRSRPLKDGETMEWIMLSGVSLKSPLYLSIP